MDDTPLTVDPDTGKIKVYNMQTSSWEWRDFSDCIEDRANFEEGCERDVESTTDEEKRAIEACYGLPAHMLDEHDKLFRLYAIGNLLNNISHFEKASRRKKKNQAIAVQMGLVHKYMAGSMADCDLDDICSDLKRIKENDPDLLEILAGRKEVEL